MIAFTSRFELTPREWDDHVYGWHCPHLGRAEINIKNIFHKGSKINVNDYEIDRDDRVIYWKARTPVPTLLVVNFSTGEDKDNFKKLINPLTIAISVAIIGLFATITSSIISSVLPEWYKRTHSNETSQEAYLENKPLNRLGSHAIALETITQEDGGLDAAKKQLEMKADNNGYKNNSVILKHQDTYRVVIYFSNAVEAQSHIVKARTINRTVNKVKDLNDWCGNYAKVEYKIFECSKNILN
jgi:hypothetical protein